MQQGSRRAPRPGPLAQLVRAGAHRTLQQYLLLLALATAKPYEVRRAAAVWHRALALPETANPSSVISKSWRRLADLELVEVRRAGRLSAPRLLREDGTGTPYVPPDGSEQNRYFDLPFEYWLGPDPWYRKLTMPETAMLLVALSLEEEFVLPVAKAPTWYGISKDTAQRGLRGLYQHDILDRRLEWKETTFVDAFYTQERFYRLRPPFASKRPRGASSPP